eukprot:TRINITY_DN51324_c0_g1_i1.p1 TRINITY_DN51324_c0_g1~~TRINITY_DN51324_c0_g1_i1.p1  ORF type:complete len:119 (-),score=15.64 TRINITY_DN51324_c0_g1_i1:108-464(-)
MASLGSAVSSVTRPLKAKMKPACAVAEHRLAAPVTAMIAAPAKAVAAPTNPSKFDYAWNVTWPGKTLLPGQPIPNGKIFKYEGLKSFKTWEQFTLGDPSFWASVVLSAATSVNVPGKK